MDRKPVKGKCVFIIRRLIKRYFRDAVSKTGAELAYFFLFSFFPLLIFANLLIATFDIRFENIEGFLKMVPPDVRTIANEYFGYIGRFESKTLLYMGLVLTLYFFSRAVDSLINAVNNAYRARKKRPGIRNVIFSLGFTAVFMVSFGVMFFIMITGKNVLLAIVDWVRIPILTEDFIYLWNGLRYLIAAVYSFFLLVFIYCVFPNKKVTFRSAVPGALFAMLSWVLISSGFSFYVQNMGRYSALYGSIGAVMVLMLWLYLTGVVLVMGAELNDIITTFNEECESEFNNKNL
ncbi:MAG: YihY/virulence factor BrkB family protein [Bacillota bacterium]|nr:YihY/virulence factor BrkB family protein [Bacillota bacterium]